MTNRAILIAGLISCFIIPVNVYSASMEEKQQKEEQKQEEKKNDYDSNRDKEKEKKTEDAGQSTVDKENKTKDEGLTTKEEKKKTEDGGQSTVDKKKEDEGKKEEKKPDEKKFEEKKPEDSKKPEEKKPEEIKKPLDKKIVIKKKIGSGNDAKNVTTPLKPQQKSERKIVNAQEEEYETYEVNDTEIKPLGAYGEETYQGSYSGGLNLDLKYSLGFAAKYSLLGTYHSSTLESVYFGGTWNGDMLFTGNGGEINFTVMGVGQKNLGVSLALGYYYFRTITNSYSDTLYSTTETAEIKLLEFKVEGKYYPQDWFYVKGGFGGSTYIIDTNIETTMPGFVYTGLEGSTTDYEFTIGAGLDIKLFSGFSVTAGVDASIFLYDKVQEKGLRDYVMPYCGIVYVW